MQKLANQVIDAYDDLFGEHLKKFGHENPGANLLTPEEKARLDDDAYALCCITKEGSKLNKFPLCDKDNVWVSNKMFPLTCHKLAASAAGKAAYFIKKACESCGIEPEPLVKEWALTGDHFPASKLATNVWIENPRGEATIKTAAPTRLVMDDFAEVDRICGNYTHAQQVFATPTHVKVAEKYFEEKHGKMPLETRHKYAAAIQIRARELGMPAIGGTIAKYASDHYSAHLDGHLASRRRLLDGREDLVGELNKLASAKQRFTPYQFAQVLNGFDKKAGLNRYYGGYLQNPFESTFAAEPDPQAGYRWQSKTGSRALTAEEIRMVVNDQEPKIAEYFGKSIADEMKKDPVVIFESLPDDAKAIIANIKDGLL